MHFHLFAEVMFFSLWGPVLGGVRPNWPKTGVLGLIKWFGFLIVLAFGLNPKSNSYHSALLVTWFVCSIIEGAILTDLDKLPLMGFALLHTVLIYALALVTVMAILMVFAVPLTYH